MKLFQTKLVLPLILFVKSKDTVLFINIKEMLLSQEKKPDNTTDVPISGQEKLLDLEDLLPQLNM